MSCCGGKYNSLYSQLGNYSQGYSAGGGCYGIQSPTPVTTSGYYVVPAYGAPGYSTLTHGPNYGAGMNNGCNGGNAGYFQIGQAYGSGGTCNTQYMSTLCK